MRIKKRDVINMSVSVVITVAALLVTYAVKGIYPFGSGNILGGDLYQLYIPNFFHIYDSFHGGSLFYDLTTGGGLERNIISNIFQPTTWFLLLLKRNQIINSISLLLIAKLGVISLTASFSFSKLFKKLSVPFTVLISLIYTFSGYNLEYYTNLGWLDAVALYPLLILALYKMFEGKSKLPFVIVFTYLLSVHTYMAFFAVVSLIVFGGLYIFLVPEKDKKKEYVYSLGAGTVMSLVASAYPILYYAKGWLTSARFENYGANGKSATVNHTSLMKIVFSGYTKSIISILLFIGLELAVACLAMLFIKCIKNKDLRGITGFFGISAFILAVQAVCKGTDLIWHGGSRIMFPFRNGYIAAFIACLIIGYYMSEIINKPETKNIFEKKKAFIPYAVFGVFAVLAALYSKRFYAITENFNVLSFSADQTKYFFPGIILFGLITIAYFMLLSAKNKRAVSAILLVCSFSVVMFNTFGFVGNYEGGKTAEKYNKYYADCNEVGEVLAENDEFERVVNPDISLITNYSYIAKTHSVSNWVNSLTQEQIMPYKNLGYSTEYTRTLDSGATLFSKALMRTTNSVSKAELDEKPYELIETTDSGINVYKNKYVLPFGLTADSNLADISFGNNSNTFEYQNRIYSSLSGDKAIFEELKPKDNGFKSMSVYDYAKSRGFKKMPRAKGTVNVGTAEIKTKPDSTLYLIISNENTRICRLTVNGKVQIFRKNAEEQVRETTFFPTSFNNNTYEIGTFNGESIKLEYELLDGKINDLGFFSMDNSKLAALCEAQPETEYSVKGDTITVKMNSVKDGYAFFPLSYSAGRECTVNGKAVKSEAVLGNFTAVKVSSGSNEIVMKNSRKSGLLITAFIALSFVIACALVLIEKRIKNKPEWLKSFMYGAFMLLVAGAYTLIYVLPVIGGALRHIIK